MVPLRLFVLVAAAVLFLLAGLGIPSHPRFQFIGWGLFLCVVSVLMPLHS